MKWWRATSCAILIGMMPFLTASGQEPSRPAQVAVGLMAAGPGSTDTEIAAEIAYALSEEPRLRVLPILGQTAAQTITDLAASKTVDVAIMHADALTDLLLTHAVPRANKVEYIAKLFQEEVHVLAQQSVSSIADLAGKPVEVGPSGSATALTAQAILSGLHVAPDQLHDPETVALERLRLGQAAAVIVVGGKPVPALLRIPPASGLHFLPVPLTPQLVDTYLPSSLESSAYPGLVPQGQVIETVAVGSILVTLANQAGDARGKRVDRFVDALFAHFDTFRQPGFHPKWREVSLSAQIAGLKRYNEADRLLREAAKQASTRREARH